MILNDKQEIKNFRADFANAVAGLEAQYDIKITLGNISCTPNEFHCKLSVTTGDEEKAADVARDRFKLLAGRYGFREDDFMATFTRGNKSYEILGFNTKAPKNPVILRDINTGKEYRAPAALVLLSLGR